MNGINDLNGVLGAGALGPNKEALNQSLLAFGLSLLANNKPGTYQTPASALGQAGLAGLQQYGSLVEKQKAGQNKDVGNLIYGTLAGAIPGQQRSQLESVLPMVSPELHKQYQTENTASAFNDVAREYSRLNSLPETPEIAQQKAELKNYAMGLDPKEAGAMFKATGDFGGGGESSDTQLYATLVNSPKKEDRARAAAMLAFRRAQAAEASDTTLAKRWAEIATAAKLESEKERGKVEGGGEVTPKEKIATARTTVSDVLSVLKGHYEDLAEKGAIVNVEDGAVANASARVRSSGIGQLVGKTVGTEEQSIRNKINQIKPLLINYIRQASEMGARGLDSEKELAFYLQAATDPSLDIQTNLAAIQVLENAYGIKLQEGATEEAQPDAAKTSDSPQKVKPKGKRKQGRDGKWYVNDGKGWRPE